MRSVLQTAGFETVEVNPGPDEVILGPADRLEAVEAPYAQDQS